MKKAAIWILFIFSSLYLWLYPVFSPLDSYTQDCRSRSISKTSTDLENLTSANAHIKACKVALAKNDAFFKEKNWQKQSWCKLYSERNINMLIFHPNKFKLIRENNAILDSLILNSCISASINAKLYKNADAAFKTLDDAQKIANQYSAYSQITKVNKTISSQKRFIQKKFLSNNKRPQEQN
jgi:phosphorylcholine metabolism protein LicD